MPVGTFMDAGSARMCVPMQCGCQIGHKRTITCSACCQECCVDRRGPDSMNFCKAAGQQPLPPQHHIQAGLAQQGCKSRCHDACISMRTIAPQLDMLSTPRWTRAC